jgi:hypothetical protein
MHNIPAHLNCKVSTNGTWFRLEGIRRPNQLPCRCHNSITFQSLHTEPFRPVWCAVLLLALLQLLLLAVVLSSEQFLRTSNCKSWRRFHSKEACGGLRGSPASTRCPRRLASVIAPGLEAGTLHGKANTAYELPENEAYDADDWTR